MQIGVDACCWANKRGFGRFTRELLKALITLDKSNEYFFFIDEETALANLFPEGVNIIITPTRVSPVKAASASGRRSLKDLWVMTREVRKYKLDIFFFPAVYSYFPILNRTKVIVTIHDMIADRHSDKVFPAKRLMLFWKLKQYVAVKQAQLLLTVSEYSKKKIIEYFHIAESRIQVISEGPGSAFKIIPQNKKTEQILDRYRLSANDSFLLYVGGISPHKNLKTLIDVYDQLIKDKRFENIKLILVGDYQNDSFHSDYPILRSHIDHLGIADRVIFTGYIHDTELAVLYNSATLLVFPSLEEGFGLPAVEAMACGTPVVASKTGSLPEILDDAGRFFDPLNPQEMLEVLIKTLLNDQSRKRMGSLGLKRAKLLSWDRAAGDLLKIFNKLAEM